MALTDPLPPVFFTGGVFLMSCSKSKQLLSSLVFRVAVTLL